MADEDTQSREESLWWGFDASSDSSLPTATFDEPLAWPDALPWEEFDAGPPRHADFPDPDHLDFELLFPPTDPVTVAEPLRPAVGGQPDGADDGGDPTELHMESLPESIWAADPAPDDDDLPRLVTITGSISAGEAPEAPVYAEAERAKGRRRPGWLAVPRGNAAVVALISFVSLVLLGMFLSVRARNDVPTETSRTPVTSADIAATRPLNTVPLTTATTPPSTIALSDLIPPADGTPADTGSNGTGAGTTPRTAAPATTAPRAAAPAGGGGSTQPTTATTAAATPTPAPTPAPTDTTTATTAPADTTQTTRRTTTTIDMPSPTFTIPDFTIPTVTTRPTVRGN